MICESDELDGQWVVDASLTNVFEFVQGVLGVYGMAAYESILGEPS